jgi:uncharacterized tellurite resistance protein B-like protein
MSHAFKTPIKLMNDAQREWFATALVAMILADGNVSKGEVEMLLQSISFVKNPQAVERLKKFVQYQTLPTLSPFHGWEKEVKYRAVMLVDLMSVAIADRDFSPKEREQFHQIGKTLGFTAEKVDELAAMGDRFIEKLEPGT